eukprot:762514-Hanusia_phi.AAC.11
MYLLVDELKFGLEISQVFHIVVLFDPNSCLTNADDKPSSPEQKVIVAGDRRLDKAFLFGRLGRELRETCSLSPSPSLLLPQHFLPGPPYPSRSSLPRSAGKPGVGHRKTRVLESRNKLAMSRHTQAENVLEEFISKDGINRRGVSGCLTRRHALFRRLVSGLIDFSELGGDSAISTQAEAVSPEPTCQGWLPPHGWPRSCEHA